MQGSCASGVVGGFCAYALMRLDGVLSLAGWQWLFLAEGLPAIALGCYLCRLLPAGPQDATFLSPRERAWLAARAASGDGGGGGDHGGPGSWASVGAALRNPRCYQLGAVHGLALSSFYALLFFSPQIVKSLLTSPLAPSASGSAAASRSAPSLAVVSLSTLPYVLASAAVLGNAWHARARRECRLHAAVPLALGALCMLSLGPLAAGGRPRAALASLCACTVGCWAHLGPLATLWRGSVPASERAASFGVMNGIGNVGGFAGPFLLGALTNAATGDATRGLSVLGCLLAAAAGLVFFYRPPAPRAGDGFDDGKDDDGVEGTLLLRRTEEPSGELRCPPRIPPSDASACRP